MDALLNNSKTSLQRGKTAILDTESEDEEEDLDNIATAATDQFLNLSPRDDKLSKRSSTRESYITMSGTDSKYSATRATLGASSNTFA